jgi:hypothetical protein
MRRSDLHSFLLRYGVASCYGGDIKIYEQYQISGSHGKGPVDWAVMVRKTEDQVILIIFINLDQADSRFHNLYKKNQIVAQRGTAVAGYSGSDVIAARCNISNQSATGQWSTLSALSTKSVLSALSTKSALSTFEHV